MPPMGKKLLFNRFSNYILLTAIFFCCSISISIAQIAITDSRHFEVSFSTQPSQFQKQSATISVHDIQSIFGDSYSAISNSWDQTAGSELRYYVKDSNGVAIRGLIPDNATENSFAALSFFNQTEVSFEGAVIAFDFLYRSEPGQGYSYYLRYRVNRNEWKEVVGSVISSSNLRETGDEWNTFSIQSRINEMHLRQNDTIHFEWISRDDLTGGASANLALHHIELNPIESTMSPPSRGSLVITEILPASQFDSGVYEYVEIYNPTAEPIELKGMALVSQAGEVVIQTELVIEPYQFLVLSNRNAAALNGLESNYIYPERVTESTGGYIELQFDGIEVAKATYESSSPGVALELDRVSNSFDGYTSLQHLTPSTTELSRNITGSPGHAGGTTKLYSKQYSEQGLHLVTTPGLLSVRLNRHSSLEFTNLNGILMNADAIHPFQPFLIVKQNSEELRLFADESPQVRMEPAQIQLNDHSAIITVPSENSFQINSLVNEFDEPVSPVVMIWNHEKRAFQVKHGEDFELNSWTPIIVNSEADAPVQVLPEHRTSAAGSLERFINLRLFEERSNTREIQVDEALLGFVYSQRLRTQKRFDLQKFFPLAIPDKPANELSMLYLSNALSSSRTNSFTHVPYELDDVYRVGLGFVTSKNSFQGILDWSEMAHIPEEWILSLEDRVTGSIIDMREQTSYRFRSSTNATVNPEEVASSPFMPVTPAQSERFVITMKPYESSLETTDTDTRPGSVELRQNYPNPFNPATNIAFYLPKDRHVRIGVYNVVGQQVGLLLDEPMGAGEHSVVWNAMDMPSGVYIVQLESGNRIFTRKITLIK
jgi:hypothetical protein